MLTTLVKTVTTAGTAEALSSTDLVVRSFTIRAKSDNGGNVYIGNSDIDSTGLWLAASETYNYTPTHHTQGTHKGTNLADWYIDVDTNGEGVVVAYEAF